MSASSLSPIQPTEAPPTPSGGGLRLPLDPLLTLAVIGLGICSIFTLRVVTSEFVPGQPHYYVDRQAIYLFVGFVAMLVLSRVDYARLRHLMYPIYGALLLSILAVLALGHETTLGAQRAIEFPLFSFQASELGKVLLILALSAFVVSRSRRLRELDTTARVLLVGAHTGDVRDRPARSGLGHGLHGDRVHAAVRRRHLLATDGGTGGASSPCR